MEIAQMFIRSAFPDQPRMFDGAYRGSQLKWDNISKAMRSCPVLAFREMRPSYSEKIHFRIGFAASMVASCQKSLNWPAQYPSIVIGVDDSESAMRRVAKEGGKVLGEPMQIPGIGRYVSFIDTEGNRVSMLQPDRV